MFSNTSGCGWSDSFCHTCKMEQKSWGLSLIWLQAGGNRSVNYIQDRNPNNLTALFFLWSTNDWFPWRAKRRSGLWSQDPESMHAFCIKWLVVPNSHPHLYREPEVPLLLLTNKSKRAESNWGEGRWVMMHSRIFKQRVHLEGETSVYLGWLYFYTYLVTNKWSALMYKL